MEERPRKHRNLRSSWRKCSHSCVMRAIESAGINHPHGPQEHHFGTRHERVFSYHFWRPILRMVQSGSRFLDCRRVHKLFLSGVSVYPACTSLGPIRCFWRFSRLIETVTYAFSVSLLVRSPPPLPFIFLMDGHLTKRRGGKKGQIRPLVRFFCCEQLRLLDRWLAEEVLSLAFKGGHRKSHFRLLPFRSLRAMGLHSLVHRRRQIRHGRIAAPFFVWKNYQRQKSSRETAARLRPLSAGATAFSPSPEAVTAQTSREDLVGERRHLSRGLIEVGKSEDLPTFP